MKDFCIDADGVVCPAKHKGALTCSSYKGCLWEINRNIYYQSVLDGQGEHYSDEETDILKEFSKMSERQKETYLRVYRIILSIYNEGKS